MQFWFTNSIKNFNAKNKGSANEYNLFLYNSCNNYLHSFYDRIIRFLWLNSWTSVYKVCMPLEMYKCTPNSLLLNRLKKNTCGFLFIHLVDVGGWVSCTSPKLRDGKPCEILFTKYDLYKEANVLLNEDPCCQDIFILNSEHTKNLIIPS